MMVMSSAANAGTKDVKNIFLFFKLKSNQSFREKQGFLRH